MNLPFYNLSDFALIQNMCVIIIHNFHKLAYFLNLCKICCYIFLKNREHMLCARMALMFANCSILVQLQKMCLRFLIPCAIQELCRQILYFFSEK